jgi:UTP--glucose-1-phosphate uridylyltransferase
MTVRKAIIPAAGLGTRMLPATKAVPKEMLPLADTPTIQFIVEEAAASGIEQIAIVTSRSKRAIEDHFDMAPELEAFLAAKGKQDLLTHLRRGENLARLSFVRQQRPLGLGHAVLVARELIGDEPCGVLLGDDLVAHDGAPCLQQLIEVHERYGGSVLAVMRVPRDQLSRYGVVQLAADTADRRLEDREPGLHRVRGLIEKPATGEAPSDLAIIGRYVLSPSIFAALEVTPPGVGGEIQLTDAIRRLGEREPVWAYEFAGTRYDTGDPVGLLTTSLAFALARADLAPGVLAYLRTLNLEAERRYGPTAVSGGGGARLTVISSSSARGRARGGANGHQRHKHLHETV